MHRTLVLLLLCLVTPACVRAADPPSASVRTADPSAIGALRSALSVEARYADDPWALSHALLAFGPDFPLESKTTLLERLESLAIPDSVDGARYELFGADGRMGEMHPHLVFKTLAGAGLAPDLCARLGHAVHEKAWTPASTEEWNDTAWLIEALARSAPADAAEDAKRRQLAGGILARVEAADRVTAGLFDASGTLTRPKGGGDPSESGIWAYTCGGQHLLQGLLVAAGKGLLAKEDRPRIEASMALFLRRVKGEAAFRDAEKEEAIAAGVNRLLAEHNGMVQVLKLEGHALETLARARDAGIGDPVELRRAATGIRDDMETRLAAFRSVLDLGKLLPSVRAGDPGTWRKWFGDGCHALHGLSLWPDLPPMKAER